MPILIHKLLNSRGGNFHFNCSTKNSFQLLNRYELKNYGAPPPPSIDLKIKMIGSYKYNLFPILFFLIFGNEGIVAQDNTHLSQPESFLLRLLVSDTLSSTVDPLPLSYRFHDQVPKGQHLILAKEGKNNFLVLERGGRVFIPDPFDPLDRVIRIDTTQDLGDQYRMIPFLRRDTLFAFGCDTFNHGRCFFAFYSSINGKWTMYQGSDSILGNILLTYYDRSEDRFYVIESYSKEIVRPSTLPMKNRVQRYDFKDSDWKFMGEMEMDEHEYTRNSQLGYAWTDGHILGILKDSELVILDPVTNTISGANLIYSDELAKVIATCDTAEGFPHSIKLGDSLYFFCGDHENAWVKATRFQNTGMNWKWKRRMFIPVSENRTRTTEPFPGGPVPWVIGSMLIMIPLFTWVGRRGRKAMMFSSSPFVLDQDMSSQSVGLMNGFSIFHGSLTGTEKSLMLELARLTLEGEHMEAALMNQLLGLSNRKNDVQKVHRSQTITQINSKFMKFTGRNEVLIRRERDPVDKRIFLYCMKKEFARVFMEMDTKQ